MKKQILLALLIGYSYLLSSQSGTISGTISRLNGDPVSGVTIQLTGAAESTTQTDENGSYSFAELPIGGDYTIIPLKTDETRQCVSIRDALVIGKHFTGITLIDNPYALLAADVNNSETISLLDLIGVVNLVQGRSDGFSDNTSWRFVDSNYEFPNPMTPWQEPMPEVVSINNLGLDVKVDFVAIKVGDPTDCVGDAPAAPFLTVSASDVSGEPGDQVTVDITVDGFTDISGLQFSLAWDQTVLELDGVSNTMALNLFPTQYNSTQERFSLSWFSNTFEGVNLSDGTTILSLEFTIVGQHAGNSTVCFVEDPTPFEVVDGNCFPSSLETHDGEVSITGAPIFFSKLYGDDTQNTPTKIKAFPDHNGLYVAGTSTIDGEKFATFSKFNQYTGDLEWDFKLSESSIFHDFEFVPETKEFLLVGATEPFQVDGVAQDNESLLVKVDDNGQLIFGRKYQQTGREHFNRILLHPDPRNPEYPYYIVGTINPEALPPFYPQPPSSTDRVIVWNINKEGIPAWQHQYDYGGTAVPDDEFHRGLFAVNFLDGGVAGNGDIIITGNDSPTNDGIMVEIHGATGDVIQAIKLPTGFDIYDGVEVIGGATVIVGSDFIHSKAFFSVFRYDPLTSQRLAFDKGLIFEDITEFREVGMQWNPGVSFYTTGRTNFPSPSSNHNYIHRIRFDGPLLDVVYARRIEDGSTQLGSPKIMTSIFNNQLYYADERQSLGGGFGNTDMLVGSFDFEISNVCTEDKAPVVTALTMTPEPIDVTTVAYELFNSIDLRRQDIAYNCQDICTEQTCEVSFEWEILSCGRIQFTAINSNSEAPQAYTWDMGCDGSTNSNDASPVFQFPQCGATIPICLTVDYGEGIICSYEEEVSLPADNTPPILAAFLDISVVGSIDGNGNCTAEVDIPVPNVIESCSLVSLTNDYTGFADASGTYPQGETVVTYTTTDECGNSSSFSFSVKVACRNCGEAVITCFPGFQIRGDTSSGINLNDAVLGIVDVRNTEGVSPGSYLANRSGQNIYHPNTWTYNNLGLVFGLAVDRDQNIYAASTTIFGCGFSSQAFSPFGPSELSRIYKIDPFDNISILVEQGEFVPNGTTIPSDKAGFGNICYDPDHHQLFATNFHDGLIYRIDLTTGTVVDRFDPFLLSSTTPSSNDYFIDLGQRPWGIAYNKLDGKLYYSKWNEDRNHRSIERKNEIWSVYIDATTGEFEGEDALVIKLPDHIDTYINDNPSPIYFDYSNPVSDIAFSEDGQMLIAERSVKDDCGDVTRLPGFYRWYSHQARVLEYEFNGTTWGLTPGHGNPPFSNYAIELKYRLGTNHQSNGATTSGGVDYGYAGFNPQLGTPTLCDEFIWASGDCLHCNRSCNAGYYGIQGIPAIGGDGCSSFHVDFDGRLGDNNKVQQGDVEVFKCISCPPPDTCQVTFGWKSIDCNLVQFSSLPTNHFLVSSYSWDVGCDGTIESTVANPELPIDNCGEGILVCLTVVYQDGSSCSYEELVILPTDNSPPVISCPEPFTISTDPGLCQYSFDLAANVTDNCSPNPQESYQLSGSTEGTGSTSPILLNEGETTITLTAIDLCGNESLPCEFEVTVVDEEAPLIQCPATVTKDTLGCSAGAIVDYIAAQATDNCGLGEITYDMDSGSFFSCGETVVTATATDLHGNVSTCSFAVIVNGCQDCAQLTAAEVTCGPVSGQYEFTLSAENLTNLQDEEAIITVSSPDGEVTLTDNQLPEIAGTITVEPPLNSEFTFEVSFEFPCSLGVISCTDSIKADTPCCEEIFLSEQAICNEVGLYSISLEGDLDYLTGVDYIRWYVGNEQCETFNLIWQSAGISDFTFSTTAYPNSDFICVYAELIFLPGKPCEMLVAEPQTIYLCDPVVGSVANTNGPFCSDAVPATFEPLVYTSHNQAECDYTIQWYIGGEAIPGATSDTYTPTGLTFTGGEEDCCSEYEFEARITNLCGTKKIGTSILIYNVDAPIGELYLNPFEELPICIGEDLTLKYDPKCIGPEVPIWKWLISTDNQSFTGIDGAGSANPVWNTNPLAVDTWYRINRQNGVCPGQETTFFVDVKEELSITSFLAIEDDPCSPTQIDLSVVLEPEPLPNCPVLVHWYKDGMLLHTATTNSSQTTYSYTGESLAGNYYVRLEDICCNEEVKSEVQMIEPSMEVLLTAPCFRCNDQVVTLEGLIVNAPPNVACTYQWYRGETLLPNETEIALEVDEGGVSYTLEVTCGDCTKSVSYYLPQCGANTPVFCTCSRLADDVAAGFTFEPIMPSVYEFKPVASLREECNELTWDWGDGTAKSISQGSESVQHTFPVAGPINVRMEVLRTEKDDNTCIESFTRLITESSNFGKKPSVRIYPNPSTDQITLELWNFQTNKGSLQVLDLQGKLIQQTSLKANQDRHYIALEGLPAGTYVINILNQGRIVWTENVVKL